MDPLILAWCTGFISGIPRSIILLLLLLFVGVDASCEIPRSDAIACLPRRVVVVLVFNIR